MLLGHLSVDLGEVSSIVLHKDFRWSQTVVVTIVVNSTNAAGHTVSLHVVMRSSI